MELLIAQRLNVSLGGDALLANLHLRLSAGDRVGLIGPNGSGKSTLLRVLAGRQQADSGRLWRAPGVRVGYLPQSEEPASSGGTVWQVASGSLALVRELEGRMRELEQRSGRAADGTAAADAYARLQAEFEQAGGYAAEAVLRRELAALGFEGKDDERLVTELSAGERRRLALAGTLAAAPDLLLLDEPTNHLDLATREWLGRRLTAWNGALMIVSHDRALLDAATTRTAFLEPAADGAGNRLTLEPGPYSTAAARRTVTLRASHKRERERAKEAARLEAMAAELARFGHKAHARKRGAERRLREVTKVQLPASRAATPGEEAHSAPQLAAAGRAAVRGGAGTTLVEATALSSPPLLNVTSLRVNSGDRIALLGPNGSGKSTLLELLSGSQRSADPRSELRFAGALRLRHVGQVDRGLHGGVTLWDQATQRIGAVTAGRLLSEAGLPPRTWSLPPTAVSGGERARAGLALALAEDADLWLLDEPTNDLDLAAVEALEAQLLAKLEASGAALLLTTHDRRLAERLTTEVWAIEAGAVVRYSGVAAYLAGERSGLEPQGPVGARTPTGVQEAARASDREADATEADDAGRHGAGRQHFPDLDDLELRRVELLRLRDEEPGLTERDRERVHASLAETEGALMAAYAATLPAPAPLYRLVERGYTMYADWVGDPRMAAPSHLVVVVPQVRPGDTALGAGVAAATLLAALAQGAGLPDPDLLLDGFAAAWLEVRLVDAVGHLRLVERARASVLPSVRVALVDAGVRLAFTRLNARAVQLHRTGELEGSLLRPAGHGWWYLTLEEFLEADGWGR